MEKTEIYEILERQYFGDDCHEQSELDELSKVIQPSIKQIFDVGASLGQYTQAFAKLAHKVPIVAIESDPIRLGRLKHNCADWRDRHGADIEIIEAAASDSNGQCEFFTTESNISGSFNAHNELSKEWKKIVVPAVTLDELTERSDNIFVKMDIEGGEFAALMGAQRLLEGNGNTFLIELHVWGDESRNKKVRDVLDIFSGHEYAVSKFHGHYLFQKNGTPNFVQYLRIRTFFWIKELIYFSPLRSLAQWANRQVKAARR